MMKVTHAIAGGTTGIIAGVLLYEDVFLHLILGLFFGTVPDLDIHFEYSGIIKHRGVWSHSLMSSMLLAIVAVAVWTQYPEYIPQWAWVTVFAATWLHTAFDSLTVSGTHLFYPITKKRFRGPVRYDSITANAMLTTMCLGISIILLQPNLLQNLINTFA